MRWDEDKKTAVPASKAERDAARSAQQHPTGAAAQYEHYHDEESLQTYVRREVAPRVRTLVTRQNASWEVLHELLAKYHLRMEKGEAGGYTVLATDHNIRVKASDVFRHNFAGKDNRNATEQLLGRWIEPVTSLQPLPTDTGHTTVLNPTLRAERREQRLRDRNALLAEFNQYRNQQRSVCKGITVKGREDRQQALIRLKQRKREIRALAQPWRAKKILLSEAVAASVIELRVLKMSTQKTRQAQFPNSLRTWVAERAAEGDARAGAQLRGWRYADQRNQRRLEATLETNALHLGPATEDKNTDWSEFMQQRLAAQRKAENLAEQVATARIWTINRTSGDVSYTLNGKLSVIDRGRRVTVLNRNEAAIVFGLEMAVQKYGSRIACSGGDDWKRQVVKVAVQNGIFVEFTDPETSRFIAFRSHWRYQSEFCNPARGNEKGGVEGEGGYFRRNHWVPVPQARNLDELNTYLERCSNLDRQRILSGRTETVGAAMLNEQPHLLAPAAEPFDLAEISFPTVDSLRCVRVRTNRYSVPLPPGTKTEARVHADTVDLWHGGKLVARHERSYSRQQKVLDLEHYLDVLRRNGCSCELPSILVAVTRVCELYEQRASIGNGSRLVARVSRSL
jgi:hypothetical protein